jgi:O-antigen ligase
VGIVSALAGIAAVVGIVALRLPPRTVLLVPAVPCAAAILLVLFATVQRALCLAAFAIAPLGIVQAEILGVTLNLPEVLILALFLRVGVVFLLHGERPAIGLPITGLAAYLAAACIGVVTGLVQGHGVVAVLQDFRQFTEFVALYLIVVHRVSTPKQVKQIVACFFAGCALLALHGIVERFTNIGIPLMQVLSDAVYHGATRSGSFYGATPLGALLVLAICGSVALMLSTRSWFTRLLLGVATAVCLTTIVFTNTRASWVSLFFALIVVFLSIRKTPRLVLTVAVTCLVFGAALGSLVVARMEKIEFTKGERSLLERVDYYKTAWYIFRKHPTLGLGWGAAYRRSDVLANKRYVPRPRPRVFDEKFSAEESTVHSAYLQLLVKIGLIGLAGFLCILFSWFLRVMRAWRAGLRDELDYNLFVGITAALLGYLVHCSLENFFQWPVMAQSFWLYMGLSTVMANILLEHSGRSTSQASPGPRTA